MKYLLDNIFYLVIVLITGGIALLGIMLGPGGVVLMTVPFGIACGLILGTKILGPLCGAYLSGEVYAPKNVAPPPPEFPFIRAKIAKEQYEEAVADLEKLLEEAPGNIHVIQLLVEIFVDRTGDHENAIGLITAYLKKNDRRAEDIPIVMKLVDVYLDCGAPDKAKELLKSELSRKYPEKESRHLRSRLDGI